jgi:hypothetical protein
MKHFILFLAALALLTACGSSRQISAAVGTDPWLGRDTEEILDRMGTPDRIDPDGKDGSILVYESAPDYSSPDYDILAPEAEVRPRRYAHFYLDDEGRCYRVDANRTLPAPYSVFRSEVLAEFWLDLLLSLPVLTILALL